jgi:geranylgeranylglycerol-phosphate geranylgeranyltransferase
MAAILGFGNSINDLIDIDIDRIGKPWRPLPAGTVSKRFAIALALSLGVIALLSGAVIGLLYVVIVTVMLIASWLYSVRLKSTVAVGNVVVALLSGLTVVMGSVSVAGGVSRSGFVAVCVFLMILSTEFEKAVEDIEADGANGVHTIAHAVPSALQRPFMMAVALIYCLYVATFIPQGYAVNPGLLIGMSSPAVVQLTVLLIDRSEVSKTAGKAARLGKAMWPIAIVSLLLAIWR